MNEDYIRCMICGLKFGAINNLHLRKHKITTKEYMKKFPSADLSSKSMLLKRSKSLKGKKRTDKTKRKLSKANKKAWEKNPNIGRTGKPLSEKSKKALSKKLMGHFVSKETRKKIGDTGLGREPWNKGLTKKDDSRLQEISNKIKKWNEEFMTDEKKEQISQTLKQKYADGMKIASAKQGYRKDLDMTVRSSWEANYARILKYNNDPVIYEKDRFVLYKNNKEIEHVYTPDFKIDNNNYIELKGHASSSDNWDCNCQRCQRDKKKLKLMTEQYPDIKIILIGKKEYRKLCEKYNFWVNNWEFSRFDEK